MSVMISFLWLATGAKKLELINELCIVHGIFTINPAKHYAIQGNYFFQGK